MQFWFDANLSPDVATWAADMFSIETRHLDALGFRTATDPQIFLAARQEADVVIVTKDADFVALLERNGPPPSIVWITTGNTSNAALRATLSARFPAALVLLRSGESLVELG